jgi:hypothetical protein
LNYFTKLRCHYPRTIDSFLPQSGMISPQILTPFSNHGPPMDLKHHDLVVPYLPSAVSYLRTIVIQMSDTDSLRALFLFQHACCSPPCLCRPLRRRACRTNGLRQGWLGRVRIYLSSSSSISMVIRADIYPDAVRMTRGIPCPATESVRS